MLPDSEQLRKSNLPGVDQASPDEAPTSAPLDHSAIPEDLGWDDEPGSSSPDYLDENDLNPELGPQFARRVFRLSYLTGHDGRPVVEQDRLGALIWMAQQEAHS